MISQYQPTENMDHLILWTGVKAKIIAYEYIIHLFKRVFSRPIYQPTIFPRHHIYLSFILILLFLIYKTLQHQEGLDKRAFG